MVERQQRFERYDKVSPRAHESRTKNKLFFDDYDGYIMIMMVTTYNKATASDSYGNYFAKEHKRRRKT